MKYEPGDKIIVMLTNEEGKVVEIMNEKMVMIEVKGVFLIKMFLMMMW